MATETMGELLTRLRTERGWTQQQVADQYCAVSGTVRKDAREVGRWERDVRVPTPYTRAFIAKVFGVPVTLLDRAAAASRRQRRTPPSGPPDGSGQAGVGEAEAVDRRTFVGGMAAALVPVLAAPRHVDPALVPYFEQQLALHYQADMMLGPRDLIGTVTEQSRLIAQLVDSADGPTRLRMAQVAVSYASFAGWLYLDAGDPATALRWHDVAQEFAHRSRDRQAVACALVDRAMARTDQGSGAAVVDLCESVLTDARRIAPEIRVFALQQQAHGAALMSDRGEVDRLLDQAGRTLRRVSDEQWGTACLRNPQYVEVQRATCYTRLGHARDADRLWSQIIPQAPASARRDVGVWTARQAVAVAKGGEPERAVELSRSAVRIALDTGSARARRELGAVERAMAPWQAEAVGRDLAEVLAPVTGGA
jgi:transcriptional regulator with XRE-family HTH domain/ribosomal protein L18E